MAAHPDSSVLVGISEDYRQLAVNLMQRHRATFLVIAEALAVAGDDEDVAVGNSLTAHLQQDGRSRGTSLTVATLIAEGLAVEGNRLRHDPVTALKSEAPPFVGPVIVRLAASARAAFEMVSVGEEEPVEDFDGLYTATGILKKLYQRYDSPFARNGNSYLTFENGPSAGKKLAELYDELRSNAVRKD